MTWFSAEGSLKDNPYIALGRDESMEEEGSLRTMGRGQVGIFVLVALAIVVILLLLFFGPSLQDRLGIFGGGGFSPHGFLQSCIEPKISSDVALLGKQGGYRDPTGVVMVDGQRVKYLCYTNAYYETCVVQQALLVGQFSKELDRGVRGRANECVGLLKQEYAKRGWSVTGEQRKVSTRVVPDRIEVEFDLPLTATKGEETRRFSGFEVSVESGMYELLMIATSIIDFESTYGDSETTTYLQYYPDLSIVKTKLSDGTTVYRLRNVVTGEEFVFASRSVAWPPGYGLEATV